MNAMLALALLASDPGASTTKVCVATGTVEVKPAAAADYAPATLGAPIESDTWIRTAAGAQAAVEFADGTELRLDQNTEVHLQGPRKVSLKVGAIYAVVVQKPELFVIETKFALLETAAGHFEVKFTNRDPNSPEFKKVSRTVTDVMTLDGKINVKSRRYSQFVTTGYQCDLIDAQLNTPDPTDNNMVRTAWVNPIVAARGAAAAGEAKMRAESYLSRLAEIQKDDPSEAALRGLGVAAAPTLVSYFKGSPRPANDRRRAAARVLADVCPASAADTLLNLLKEPDAEVKASAVKGLQRLTGKDHGADEAAWAAALKGLR